MKEEHKSEMQELREGVKRQEGKVKYDLAELRRKVERKRKPSQK